MPYLVLIAGLLLGLFGLYRFILNASVSQIKALFLTAALTALAVAIFFLALTGRLPAALAALAATIPFIISLRRQLQNPQGPDQKASFDDRKPARSGQGMSKKEALEILGLSEGADRPTIEAAYKRLIKKTHPDQQGSAWMATKLNEARDVLLRKET